MTFTAPHRNQVKKTVLICPGLKGFLGHRTFSAKSRNVLGTRGRLLTYAAAGSTGGPARKLGLLGVPRELRHTSSVQGWQERPLLWH